MTPLLSQFTLQWDVPLTIYQADVKQLSKGTVQITHRNPFLEVNVAGQVLITAGPEHRTYASVYREGLTNESPIYQFLCFYRIIESIHKRRKRLEREAKRNRTIYTPPDEIYPSTKEEGRNLLNSIYPAKPPNGWDDLALNSILVSEALGQSFADITDLLAPIRDNIAHTLLQRFEELVTSDDPLAINKIERWLPAVKSMARVMIKNDFP